MCPPYNQIQSIPTPELFQRLGTISPPTPVTRIFAETANGIILLFDFDVHNQVEYNPGSAFGIGYFSYGDMPGVIGLIINVPEITAGLDLEDFPTLETLSCPNLSAIDSSNIQNGYLYISNLNSLNSISFPLLSIIAGQLYIDSTALTTVSFPALTSITYLGIHVGSASLTTVDFPALISTNGFEISPSGNITALSLPSLVTCNGQFYFDDGFLVSLSMPNFIPTDGADFSIQNNALDAASVNSILAAFVAAGTTTCNINMVGGTNSAPTGQGLIDKAALIVAGNTVTTN